MKSTNSKLLLPSASQHPTGHTEKRDMIMHFPIYESPVPYSATIKVWKPRDRYADYELYDPISLPRNRVTPNQCQNSAGVDLKDEISVSCIKNGPDFYFHAFVKASAHPNRIYLPNLPSRPTVNNEPPGYINLSPGCVFLYKLTVPVPPPRNPGRSDWANMKLRPTIPRRMIPPIGTPRPSDFPKFPSKPIVSTGFQTSLNLLTGINASIDKAISPAGVMTALQIQTNLLKMEIESFREESGEFDEEYRKLKEVIEEQEDCIRKYGKSEDGELVPSIPPRSERRTGVRG